MKICIYIFIFIYLIGSFVFVFMFRRDSYDKNENIKSIGIPRVNILSKAEELECEQKAIIYGDANSAKRLYFYYSSYCDDWDTACPWLYVSFLLGNNDEKKLYEEVMNNLSYKTSAYIFRKEVNIKTNTMQASKFFDFLKELSSSSKCYQDDVIIDFLKTEISGILIMNLIEDYHKNKSGVYYN